MSKEIFWGLRVSEPMHRQAAREADRRGMNLSEFVRYAVSVFFDQADDRKPQDVDCQPTDRPLCEHGLPVGCCALCVAAKKSQEAVAS